MKRVAKSSSVTPNKNEKGRILMFACVKIFPYFCSSERLFGIYLLKFCLISSLAVASYLVCC